MKRKIRFKAKFMMVNGVHYVAVPKTYFDNKLLSKQKQYWFSIDEEYKEDE